MIEQTIQVNVIKKLALKNAIVTQIQTPQAPKKKRKYTSLTPVDQPKRITQEHKAIGTQKLSELVSILQYLGNFFEVKQFKLQAVNPKLKTNKLDKLKLMIDIMMQGRATKNMQDFKIVRNVLLQTFLTSSQNLCSREEDSKRREYLFIFIIKNTIY
ncbi:hypothetical protein TTHERM_000481359 (macronuclear) [Tetrahymena thermophila SB210]|uniref:Uncharacterized protein n=1 Tax=Tetrahymena thermophila (strain SB210) TaxID=312017 RepID=W7X9R0_TETTS|nr:hypothetical protein TTHERM_000481359 [Tetrahymena thermophila SB210]EWS74072.1 hypothetical protein TTHERM_000481359 [Tetrahymena thermophila SB210]|eukprot:XP_012653405.1 hypothetical protein TTHERM_000481359 [Tetrahymena thermophila SB210]